MKLYIARDFMWINSVHNIFVFKGQVFMCESKDLPMSEIGSWEDFYECQHIQQ